MEGWLNPKKYKDCNKPFVRNYYTNNMQLKPFVPQTEIYLIYYPETNIVEETEDGIVTFSSIENDMNFTISSYSVNKDISADDLFKFYTDALSSYTPLTEASRIDSNNPILYEGKFTKNGTHWLWWGIGYEDQIILASVNSEFEIDDENYNLYRHLIETIEIKPFESEE